MRKRILGIDAGSVTVSVVETDTEGNLLHHVYRPHQGKPAACLFDILSSMPLEHVIGAARTSTAPALIRGCKHYDSRVALIAGVRACYGQFRSILHVGGEKFALIRFDADGNYKSLRSNTSCAAGTGGFLDQQAKRLDLNGSAELSEHALANRGEPPKIASRCSVFAKTDIIHRQQEGYSLEEICDGLCNGLANNITETLNLNDPGLSPMIFAGGVARNPAVVEHLRTITGSDIRVHEHAHLFSAIGAALLLLEEGLPETRVGKKDISAPKEAKKTYFYPPLELRLSNYPDFDSVEHFDMPVNGGNTLIEVDVYKAPETLSRQQVHMGIDIGSTSTKAMITDREQTPVCGFYTRTAGRPVIAVQGIFEAIDRLSESRSYDFDYCSVATTGSGRKFIGKLVGADCIMDEISAHARAATELDSRIDTIIEIGGQDSKFTTLRNGVVTFSKMNTVCAAGTGSFIEEQASRLNVPLSEYSKRAQGVSAPLASDRCTVFMERDVNHYLNKHYSVDEILATVLFSVRENYLQKVAAGGSIGKHVCFQGATAKNRALVAAFEQKLRQPVFVSRYCHLTGALGAALTAATEIRGKSTFRGIDIYKARIPVRTEICDLCLNHCRIRIANVKGEEVAYGFLCGRDYRTRKYVKKEKVPSLLQERQKICKETKWPHISPSAPRIGLPAGLQIFEELPLWKTFFHTLGLQTVSSEKTENILSIGKKHTGAEFCAPVSAFHGHVRSLAGQCDVIFLPHHLEADRDPEKPKRMRKYCYYTQFAGVVTSLMETDGERIKSMRPLINHRQNPLLTKAELYRSLQETFPGRFGILEVHKAYDKALARYGDIKQKLRSLYREPADGEVSVAFLGRPYTVLQPSMNKGIPDYFAQLGINTCFMDALPSAEHSADTENLLDYLHWYYPSAIMEAADLCTKTEGLYPVYVTSFKCAPDSFALEYFRRIMDASKKPYLILQLDEHDSNIGYETRIEAGVRAFKNHLNAGNRTAPVKARPPVAPEINSDIQGKTLLLPNWDPMVIPLVAANLRYAGVDAYPLEETPGLIAESMKMNTGQCIPVNVITHEYMTYIRKHGLDPAKTLLWMARGNWACNIPMYSPFIKTLINENEDVREAGVYNGTLAMVDISPIVSVKTYFAYMFGGNLKKIGCMIRPYEINRGETDGVLRESRDMLESAFLGEMHFMEAVEKIIKRLDAIPVRKDGPRPKVAIFGDVYVRDNEVINQDLIHCIEDAGGEVLITPYNDYAKIIVGAYYKKWIRELHFHELIMYKSLLAAMRLLENRYHNCFSKYLGEPLSPKNPYVREQLDKFNIRIEQDGESYENILKIFRIIREHPDISLFVQTNPAFCCPSLITEAMSKTIEKVTGVPVLTITYDGTGNPVNDIVVPYLKYAKG